jgi:hypothetical protein
MELQLARGIDKADYELRIAVVVEVARQYLELPAQHGRLPVGEDDVPHLVRRHSPTITPRVTISTTAQQSEEEEEEEVTEQSRAEQSKKAAVLQR